MTNNTVSMKAEAFTAACAKSEEAAKAAAKAAQDAAGKPEDSKEAKAAAKAEEAAKAAQEAQDASLFSLLAEGSQEARKDAKRLLSWLQEEASQVRYSLAAILAAEALPFITLWSGSLVEIVTASGNVIGGKAGTDKGIRLMKGSPSSEGLQAALAAAKASYTMAAKVGATWRKLDAKRLKEAKEAISLTWEAEASLSEAEGILHREALANLGYLAEAMKAAQEAERTQATAFTLD